MLFPDYMYILCARASILLAYLALWPCKSCFSLVHCRMSSENLRPGHQSLSGNHKARDTYIGDAVASSRPLPDSEHQCQQTVYARQPGTYLRVGMNAGSSGASQSDATESLTARARVRTGSLNARTNRTHLTDIGTTPARLDCPVEARLRAASGSAAALSPRGGALASASSST